MLTVDINGRSILRQIFIVEAISFDVVFLHPLLKPLQILVEAIEKHLWAFGQSLLGIAGNHFGPGFTQGAFGINLKLQKLALKLAVVHHIAAVRLESQTRRQLFVAGDDGCVPAREVGLHLLTQLGIKVLQFFGDAQSFTVGRVDHNQTGLGSVLQPAKILKALLVNFDFPGKPGAL